jgi:hypothetical protein
VSAELLAALLVANPLAVEVPQPMGSFPFADACEALHAAIAVAKFQVVDAGIVAAAESVLLGLQETAEALLTTALDAHAGFFDLFQSMSWASKANPDHSLREVASARLSQLVSG